MKTLIKTLIANGFHLNTIRRISAGKAILNVHKFDLFETKINYSLLYSPKPPPLSVVSTFLSQAKRNHSNPIGIGSINQPSLKSFPIKTFFKMLGGEVNSSLVVNRNIESILNTLGRNKLPLRMEGKPDDLLEEHVTQCLQYLLNHPARRYGQDRRFESLPDGIAIGPNDIVLQFDTKAYSQGFSFELDDIKRFASYINDYHQKYESYLGRMFSFLVVTSVFNQSMKTLEGKSNALYEMCQIKLCCLEARELARMVKCFIGKNQFKSSVNWKKVFSELKPTCNALKKQVRQLEFDKIL